MADQFAGKWNLVDSENFDAYMKHIGVGMIQRGIGAKLKPVLDIAVNGNHWKITSTSTFKTHVTEFELEKEFDLETIDGRKVKSIFNFDGSKLIQEEKKIDPKDKETKFTRYINPNGQLVIEMESDDLKAKRIYTKAT